MALDSAVKYKPSYSLWQCEDAVRDMLRFLENYDDSADDLHIIYDDVTDKYAGCDLFSLTDLVDY